MWYMVNIWAEKEHIKLINFILTLKKNLILRGIREDDNLRKSHENLNKYLIEVQKIQKLHFLSFTLE